MDCERAKFHASHPKDKETNLPLVETNRRIIEHILGPGYKAFETTKYFVYRGCMIHAKAEVPIVEPTIEEKIFYKAK